MKRLGIVLLVLLLTLTGCKKSGDVDTRELLNRAITDFSQAGNSAFDLDVLIRSWDEESPVDISAKGEIRKVKEFDVNSVKMGDLSFIELALSTEIAISDFGATIELGFYLYDGRLYVDFLGSKIAMDVSTSDDMIDTIVDLYESQTDDYNDGVFVIEEDEFSLLSVIDEGNVYRYEMKGSVLNSIIDEEDVISDFDSMLLFMTVSKEGKVVSMGLEFEGSFEGDEMLIEFSMIVLDEINAKPIIFPDLSEYEFVDGIDF